MPLFPRPRRAYALGLAAGLASLMTLASCIDPIDLDVGLPEDRLVVEGLITQGPGPHVVQLRRSGPFAQGINAIRPRVSGAEVLVIDGEDRAVRLTEVSSGLYQTAPGALVGVPGQLYRLRVALPDGTEYTSTAETMAEPRGIGGLRAAFELAQRVTGGVLISTPQVVLTADAERDADQPSYYRWTWRGFYEVDVCLRDDCEVSLCPTDECDPPPLERCFIPTRGRTLVQVGDDRQVTGPLLLGQRVDEFPIDVDNQRKFAHNFFIEVEQQTLTEEAYEYWSRIRDLQDRVGSLFDPPAEAVIGNVARAQDPTEYAHGHFTVTGAATERVCIRRADFSDWPRGDFPVLIGTCGGTINGSTTPPPGFLETCRS